MRYLFLALLSVCSLFVNATNYYLSSVSGDDSRTSLAAQNPLTPWKTINKLNSFTQILPGDSILFKRGESFFGTLAVLPGISGKPVVYSAFGSGENPVITGLKPITSWTLLSSGIYYTTVDLPSLNVVTLNNQLKGRGRYPKTGYLSHTTHVGNTSISGTSVGTIPFNATGAEVVIRKVRQITDRHVITSHVGNTITLGGP